MRFNVLLTGKGVVALTLALFTMNACKEQKPKASNEAFDFKVDQFGDVRILRYQVPGFDTLSLNQKKLIYFLSQAALEGRDIIFDQNCKYNLMVRRTLVAMYQNYNGDKTSADYLAFEKYLKQVWFANGIHHHYSMDKFKPGFSTEFLAGLMANMPDSKLPLMAGQSRADFDALFNKVLFDSTFMAKRVNQKAGDDLIATSANNYYGEGVTQEEVELYYAALHNPNDATPPSYGLNSRLVKENGVLTEQVWKVGGMYGSAIEKIVGWLKKAADVAENSLQKEVIGHLVDYYTTGDLRRFDTYNIAWLKDTLSQVDFVNGFIENYGDALGIKASWESVVNFKNMEATHRTDIISENAQWFEDHSPTDDRFKKKQVKGVSAKVINAAMLGGDCFPATPIGINLPNADWIRKDYGSKSVTIENITYAYDQAAKGNGFLEEFCADAGEIDLEEKYGFMTDNLHTDLHECLGHGSGQLLPGIKGDEMKSYQSTIEEARADLFGLYYMGDPKMVELGLLPDMEAYKTAYNGYIMNGLMTQLTRILPGNNVEEAHMRNRQLIAKWCFEKGASDKVIEKVVRDGKTYFKVRDYVKLRHLFGELLAEIQRIKSTGDYEAGKNLVEQYAVQVDQNLLNEVHARYAKLNLAPYSGFVNPEYVPVMDKNGQITDIKITYTDGYIEQMLKYDAEHSWLK